MIFDTLCLTAQTKLKRRNFMATCFHEAGHVVFGWLFRAEVEAARVFEETSEGEVFLKAATTRKKKIANAYAAAGGPSAEAFYYRLMGKGDDPNFHYYCLWSSADFSFTAFDDQAFSGEINPYSYDTERLILQEQVRAAILFFSGVLYSQHAVAGDDIDALMKKLIPSRKSVLAS